MVLGGGPNVYRHGFTPLRISPAALARQTCGLACERGAKAVSHKLAGLPR